MTKKTVVETVYEYNSEGKMVKKTTTETVEYDLPYFQLPDTSPYTPPMVVPYWATQPTCTCNAASEKQ